MKIFILLLSICATFYSDAAPMDVNYRKDLTVKMGGQEFYILITRSGSKTLPIISLITLDKFIYHPINTVNSIASYGHTVSYLFVDRVILLDNLEVHFRRQHSVSFAMPELKPLDSLQSLDILMDQLSKHTLPDRLQCRASYSRDFQSIFTCGPSMLVGCTSILEFVGDSANVEFEANFFNELAIHVGENINRQLDLQPGSRLTFDKSEPKMEHQWAKLMSRFSTSNWDIAYNSFSPRHGYLSLKCTPKLSAKDMERGLVIDWLMFLFADEK
jgi:hypothetical protein